MLKPHSAKDLGPLFTDNPHRMIGQDGAYSIPLGNESALWYFGDTLFGRRVPRESLWYPGGKPIGPESMAGTGGVERMLTNTGLIHHGPYSRSEMKQYEYICGADGQPKQLVPHLAGEDPDVYRVWCLHGICLGQHVYLYYMIVRMLAKGPMPVNFEIVGCGLAEGEPGKWEFRRIPWEDFSLWWDASLPQFGSSVVLEAESNMVYTYGVRKSSDGVQRCHVARVPAPRIADRSEYEYFTADKDRWSDDPRDSACIMTGMPNEMSVGYNQFLGCWLAVHSLDLTGAIVARTAPQPWGPWSEPVTLWQVKPPKLDYEISYAPLIYAGKEHPELSSDYGQTLYLTYIEFEEYFPHLVEVKLG